MSGTGAGVVNPPWPSAAERDGLDWTLIYPRPEPSEGHGSLLVVRQRQWDRTEAKRLAMLRAAQVRRAQMGKTYPRKRRTPQAPEESA